MSDDEAANETDYTDLKAELCDCSDLPFRTQR
jgi:hypothetical protein